MNERIKEGKKDPEIILNNKDLEKQTVLNKLNKQSDIFDDAKKEDEEKTHDTEIGEKPDYVGEIITIIKSNASPKVLRDSLSDYHENDLSDALARLNSLERQKVYRVLDVDTLSGIFEYADEDEVVRYLNEMDIKKAAAVVSHIDPDAAIDILRAIDRTKRGLILDLVDEDFRKDVALLASFDEDEIGSRMSTNFIWIHNDLTIPQAMNELVSQAQENDNISTIFVVDEQDIFYGAIDLKELIIARRTTPLEDVTVTSYPYVYGTEDVSDCIERLKDYSEDLIPVLDNQNKILGVITSQSIIEVVDEEMGEDYARLAGLTAEEDLNETLPQSMKKRLPWLLVLMVLGLLVSSMVGAFEEVIAQLTIVMFFQSLILDMSGNSGTQSLAVTIRVLTDENLTAVQKLKHVFKELRVGFCNGLILGLVAFIVIGLYTVFVQGRSAKMAFAVSGCVAVALVVAMTISVLFGSVIPMFFKKINIDPAVASGPLITTISDMTSVIVYYSMAWFLLIHVMGY